MEVSGVRRSWETLAICRRKLSSRLRRTRVSRSLSSSRPLIWDSSSSSLPSGLYSRRRVPGTHAGLLQVPGRPAQSAASAVLGIQYRREQDEREDEENQHWRDLLWN